MNRDMQTVVDGINKLQSEEALEVKLCLLNLLLPYCSNNEEFVRFVTEFRDALLGQ